MKDLKALSSNIYPWVGRESIHNIGGINTALLGICTKNVIDGYHLSVCIYPLPTRCHSICMTTLRVLQEPKN